ncbi:androgen-induced gene 1 protein-like [Diaphorina citri]|uniref:Androgen-induced gene 1 protein-like n=1 Tax=Diaphorina citri TaxID=121845 RepID=A0A1S3DTM1_DIACI|nr:androgen-induced gene 1 protein-like [Diaphorina citri]
MSLYVCNTFWYVYYTNRELIYPKMIEKLVPAWYNHTMHTLPVLIVFLHLILVEPESSPLPMKTSLFIQTVFHVGYMFLTFHDRYMKGVWLYKFLGYYAETWTRTLLAPILLTFVIPYIYVWIAYRINDELRPTVTKAKRKTTGKVSAKIKNKKQ